MIDEKEILKELDRMIEAQNRRIEYAEQTSNETVVYLESKKVAAYMEVRDMIKEEIKNEINNEESQK